MLVIVRVKEGQVKSMRRERERTESDCREQSNVTSSQGDTHWVATHTSSLAHFLNALLARGRNLGAELSALPP